MKGLSLRKLHYLLLAPALVFMAVAGNGFLEQRKYSLIGIQLTELGHDLLYHRDEAIALRAGANLSLERLKQDITNALKNVQTFSQNTNESQASLVNFNQAYSEQLINEYHIRFITMAQQIDNLVDILQTRNDYLLNEPASLTSIDQDINLLINNLLLDGSSHFVEHAEHAFNEMSIKNLRLSFISFVLSLLCFLIFVFINTGIRIKKVEAINKKLALMTQQAKQASEAKSTFLATMSHELRTPMNAVLGMAQIIASDTKEKNTKENIQIINQCGDHLMTILNDILDFSKAENGELQLEETQCAIADLLPPIIQSITPLASEKGLFLEVEYTDKTASLRFLADSARLRQILFNLIGNSIKFTHSGGVKVICDHVPSEQTLVFWIKDTGIGIAANKIDSLFEPFIQADASTTRRYGGTGLGLSIVKRIVTAMQGSITVSSTENVGSTFIVTLPITAVEQPANLAASAQEKPAQNLLPKLTILIVDDNAINAIVGKRLCEQLGHKVEMVHNGKKAIHMLQEKSFDLVLMDKHMPEMNGIDTIKHIREKLQLPVVIFACTADVFKESHDEFLQVGANYVLTKPIQKNSLEKSLQRFSQEFLTLQAQKTLKQETDNEKHSNVEVLFKMPQQKLQMTEEELSASQIMTTDKKTVEPIITLLVTEFEKSIQELVDGFANNDTNALFAVLHRIKGSALELQLPNLAQAAAEYEQKTQQGEMPASTELQKVVNLLSVNIHQANRLLTGAVVSKQADKEIQPQ